MYHENVGLLGRYATRGGAGDVELAIEYYRKALETIPRDSAADPTSLQSLKRKAEARIAKLRNSGG